MKHLTAALLLAGVTAVGAASAKPAQTQVNATRDVYTASIWSTLLSDAQIDRIVRLSGRDANADTTIPSTQLDLKRK
ncbi:MAG: hypothetical protein JXR14_06775 [Paracoccaceae bacterium]